MVTRILSIVTLLGALGLGYYLVNYLYGVIDEEDQIQRVEGDVIRKLTLLREAQEGHQKLTGHYQGNWDSLRMFIDEGLFPIVEVKETIFTLEYGADSIVIERDTIDYVSVKDSLFSAAELTFLDLSNLSRVPHPERMDINFKLQVDRIKRGNYFVDVIEVTDPNPFDRRRKEDSERRTRRPLRFGSLTEISTAGNWE